MGYGLPIYHVERKIEEVEKNFKDEAHIIYVTGSNREDTELGRLMHDLNCKNPSEMHSAILAERVYELKETPEGVEIMCNEMQKILDDGIEIGKKESVIALSESGMTMEEIASRMKINIEDVKRWLKVK